MDDLLTIQELISKLGISRATAYRFLSEGMPYCKVGAKRYFDLGAVQEFIEKRRDDLKDALTIGNEYTNDEIVNIFKCGLMGGMRRSHSKNALVLISFSDGQEKLYEDYWNDDILFYTGQGQIGDQSFDFAQNKTLYESNQNGITVYLFERFTNQKYQYRGIVKLVDTPFMSEEIDIKGNKRKVCKFPLKLINDTNFLSKEFLEQEDMTKQKIAKDFIEKSNDPIDVKLSQPISEITVISKHTTYNPIVGAYVKLRASGHCEFCGAKAPFEKDGEPYLELVHIIPSSDGGQDNVDNLAALCPNCAARITQLKSVIDREALQERVRLSEKAIQAKLHN